MKTLFSTIIVLFITSFALAQETHSITVKVTNAKTDNGKMIFSLNTENQFMKSQPLMTSTVTIENGVATATFENVSTGTYAVMALHDLNGNEKMDFENRRPIESYGMSNNTFAAGPPAWKDAKFDLTETTEMIVRL